MLRSESLSGCQDPYIHLTTISSFNTLTQLSPDLMMTNKRKRGSDSIITIDSDSDTMDESPDPRSTRTSPPARQILGPDKTRAMRNRLGMLQLDGSAQAYRPLVGLGIAAGSTPDKLYNFSLGDFVADDEFDEDVIDIARLARSARLSKAHRDLENSTTYRPISVIDVTDSPSNPGTVEDEPQGRDTDDYMTDDELKRYLAQLSLSQNPNTLAFRLASPQRTEINSFTFKESIVRPGKTVELFDGDFLRVKRILRAADGRTLLFGWRYRRNSQMNTHSFLPRKVNELVNIVTLTPAEFSRGVRTKEVKVAASEIKTIRRLILTNLPYSDCNLSTHTDLNFESHDHARAEGPLFCRWKYIKVEDGDQNRARARNSQETMLSLLRREEADKGFDADPVYLRELWRGPNSPGGSSKQIVIPPRRTGTQSDAIELDRESDVKENLRFRYEYGDAFCGTGGVSSGVRSVPGDHVKLKWGVDMNRNAIQSYALNFSDDTSAAAAHYCSADLFIYEPEEELRVDILHASPPCQPFAPCHTVASPLKDEINEDALFTMWELIRRCKPRVITMEETSGLLERHAEYFHALIHVFTSLNYSVQWKILNFLEYGIPQPRRRVVIIASCIGQDLPPFPKPTHGPGLLPFVTIGDVVNSIPVDAANHEFMTHFREGSNWPKRPFDANTYAKTITCAPDCYHPSGRPYTHRELASLQGFPWSHKFGKHEVKKQIGNAVPPPVATAIYTEIVKTLRRDDRLEF